MKRFGTALLVGAITTIVAAPACSQQPAPGGNLYLMGVATQKSVQEELKLTAEQTKSLDEARDKQRESFASQQDLGEEERRAKRQEAAKANDKLLADTLSAEQMTRLKQIAIQAMGPRAVDNSEVAAALKLSDDQKEKVAEIQKDFRSSAREAMGFGGGGGGGGAAGGDRAAAAKKMAEMRKAATEKVVAVFTPEQKSAWDGLVGEPFKGELQMGRGGFGGRRGGGPGGAGGGGRRGGRPTNDL